MDEMERGGKKLAKLTEEEKNQLAEENMRLVHYVANKFRNTKLMYDDLYGAALLGFTKALNAYDSERGAKFSTFAVNCMKNEDNLITLFLTIWFYHKIRMGMILNFMIYCGTKQMKIVMYKRL